MEWQSVLNQWRILVYSLWQKNIIKLACCDLCFSTISDTITEQEIPNQRLLCTHCLNELPLFRLEQLQGDLLHWPAITKGLPQRGFNRLLTVAPYTAPFDHWLKQLKYQGRFELAPLFATLLYKQWQHAHHIHPFDSVDLVISVPVHKSKWQIRGYNQAHLIAQRFANKLQVPYQSNLIKRVKQGDSQVGKTGAQRRRALRGNFAINEATLKHIKHVVLVDDVVTTGSTANEISKLLISLGVHTVTLVTVCISLPLSHKVK